MFKQFEQIHTRSGAIDGAAISPCPFCGEVLAFAVLIDVHEMRHDDGSVEDHSLVTCAGCAACGPGSPAAAPGAIAAWNRRGGRN